MVDLDLAALKKLKQAQPALEDVADDMGEQVLTQIGIASESDWFGQVNSNAVDYAESRSAELVTDIDEATRNMLRGIIADGIEQGKSRDDILAEIESSNAFSESRAQLIADTEIRMANGQGRLAGWRAARDAGVRLKKGWVLGDNSCEECQQNADDGWIDLDENFSGTDTDTDPGHVKCDCGTTVEIQEDNRNDTEEGE